MTIRRAAGLTALGSGIAMIAMLVIFIIKIARAPEPQRDGTIGVVGVEERGARGLTMGVQPLAVLDALNMRWEVRGLRAITYEGLEEVPVAVIVLRRPLAHAEAIDLAAWIRDGGRALILAEPGLSWAKPGEAVHPDLREAKLGLRLANRPDGQMALNGGGALHLRNAGRWVEVGGCALRQEALLADCRSGAGRAVLVGDTGLLDRAGLDAEAFERATALIGHLIEALEKNRPVPSSFAARPGEYARPEPSMVPMMAMGGLFWLALGALVVWVILLNMSRPARRTVATGPARAVRDPDGFSGPARIVHRDESGPVAPQ